MISIMTQIMRLVNQNLQQQMQEQISADDPSRAGLVRLGKLQDDPTSYGVSVLTHTNDRVNPDSWPHSMVGVGETLDMNVPTFEIPYGRFRWRRFTTELTQFWPEDFDRLEAEAMADLNLSRAEDIINMTVFTDNGSAIKDSFNEVAIQAFYVKSTNSEGGGTTQFIWRTKIWWQCLTGQ